MGIFFGGSGHGPESSCQISAYYNFFRDFNVFCRISIGLQSTQLFHYLLDVEQNIIFLPKLKLRGHLVIKIVYD